MKRNTAKISKRFEHLKKKIKNFKIISIYTNPFLKATTSSVGGSK
jgi:hypothetical protein